MKYRGLTIATRDDIRALVDKHLALFEKHLALFEKHLALFEKHLALREAGLEVVKHYDACREANSMAGFWTVLYDLAAELDGRADAARAEPYHGCGGCEVCPPEQKKE